MAAAPNFIVIPLQHKLNSEQIKYRAFGTFQH